MFRTLTDPELRTKRLFSDAKPTPNQGEEFSLNSIGGYPMDGKVLRYEPPRAVSFLWTDKLPSGRPVETQVAFRFTRKRNGTVPTLRHSGFRDPRHYADCSSRWAYFLTNLKSVLDHGADLRSSLDA